MRRHQLSINVMNMLRRYLSHPVWHRLLLGMTLLVMLVHATIVLYVRAPHLRDFDLHRLIGTWFLNHEHLYGCGVCYPYMPTGAMYFSLLALLSRPAGFTLRYLAAIGCLWLTCALFHRMIKGRFPELAHANLILGVVAIVLAGQFILYDLDDGGPHTILMGMMAGGLYAAWTGRERLGALWLGLAIALKVTPGLFIPFFLWKRQWRLASYTIIATLCWIVLPMVWMGPSSWWTHQLTWTRVAAGSVLGAQTEYTQINEDNIRNSGINPALMRYLVTLPPDHPLRKNDPGYVPVLDLAPSQGRLMVIVVTAGLLGIFGWRSRRPYAGPADPDWPSECSGLLILMLLLSPLTWIQHLPWLLPALYCVVAQACSHDGVGPASRAALGFYVMVAMVLNYELLGKHNFTIFLSFKPFTFAMIMILTILLAHSWKPGNLSHGSVLAHAK